VADCAGGIDGRLSFLDRRLRASSPQSAYSLFFTSTVEWFVFISSVLFSIMEAFIIVYWVRFYRILCVIIQ